VAKLIFLYRRAGQNGQLLVLKIITKYFSVWQEFSPIMAINGVIRSKFSTMDDEFSGATFSRMAQPAPTEGGERKTIKYKWWPQMNTDKHRFLIRSFCVHLRSSVAKTIFFQLVFQPFPFGKRKNDEVGL
jgi:hypothetical protein